MEQLFSFYEIKVMITEKNHETFLYKESYVFCSLTDIPKDLVSHILDAH